jgi:hypothetical protein
MNILRDLQPDVLGVSEHDVVSKCSAKFSITSSNENLPLSTETLVT